MMGLMPACFSSEISGTNPSGAKALDDFSGFMAGINLCPFKARKLCATSHYDGTVAAGSVQA